MAFFERRYQLLDKLGAGGMGEVWRAHDRLLKRDVALKRVSIAVSALSFGQDHTTGDPRAALAREFRVLASLRHPHIVSVLDYGFEQEQPYYTMSLYEGAQTLEQAHEHPLDLRLNLLSQVLQALVYLHRHGIIHRDLKPANVLIDQGNARLVDFGLAHTSAERSATGGVSGTLAYIAPEVLRGHAPSPASDLYAVGVILYELLTGKHPFHTRDTVTFIQQILTEAPDLQQVEAPPALIKCLGRLLAKEPRHRPADALSALHELHQALQRPLPQENAAQREAFLQAARFVGRERELQQLSQALEQSQEGQGGVWLVGGEAGVGKSRLLEEMRARALVRGISVYQGSARADGVAYQLWREVVRASVLAQDVTPFDAGILSEIAPDIDSLMGIQPEVPPSLPPAQQMRRIFSALARLLRALPTPTLILLEDLQWDSGEGIDLLSRLPSVVDHSRIVIIASYRHDERPELIQHVQGAHLIKLSRFDQQSISDLSQSMLGVAGTQTQVLDLLRRETEGNAFFIVEVVRALAEEVGGIEQIGSRTLPPQVFTGGIQRILQRRLSKVPPEARDWLNLCAVLGRNLDFKLVERHDAWLYACAESAVLEVYDEQWRFTHDKLREQLVYDLPPEQSQRLHLSAAQALEQVYGAEGGYVLAILEHYRQAEDADGLARYGLQAGEHLAQRGNFPAAQVILEQTLSLMQEPLERADVLLALGHVRLRQSDYQQANMAYQDALAWSEQENDARRMTRALMGMSEVAKWRDDFNKLMRLQRRGIAAARTVNDLGAIAHHTANLGIVARAQGNYAEEIRHQQEALALYQDLNEVSGIAHCLDNLGIAYRSLGDYAQALHYQSQAYALCESVGDIWGMARALNGMGYIQRLQGHLERAEQHYLESIQRFRDTGDRWGVASGHNGLAYIYLQMGNYVRAEHFFITSEGMCQTINDLWGVAVCQNGRGHVRMRLGDQAGAEAHYIQAIKMGVEIPVIAVILEGLVGYAGILIARQNYQAAALLLGCATQHPAVSDDVRQFAAPYLDLLKQAFAEAEVYLKQGALLPLQDLAHEVIRA